LGKATDNNNNIVHAGQTPVKALGVTDQHSQVQLYTEGPFDKVVTFLAVEKYRTEVVIPSAGDYPETDFLQNKTLNDLINYERKATEFALTKYKRANFTITLPEVNAHTIGELLQYFMYQTAYCGALLDINTYNQPGVEEGKQATFAMMGRKNYEKKLEEINSLKKDERFII
jgi:glucose-6-phosphate isomerase